MAHSRLLLANQVMHLWRYTCNHHQVTYKTHLLKEFDDDVSNLL